MTTNKKILTIKGTRFDLSEFKNVPDTYYYINRNGVIINDNGLHSPKIVKGRGNAVVCQDKKTKKPVSINIKKFIEENFTEKHDFVADYNSLPIINGSVDGEVWFEMKLLCTIFVNRKTRYILIDDSGITYTMNMIRKPVTKVTREEIANKLGIDIEQLEIID